MRKMLGRFSPAVLAAMVLLAAACGVAASKSAGDWLSDIDARSNKTQPFIPPWPSPEYKNYVKAQKLYASPTTIQWCTTTWGNPSAPMVTFPVVGKLTSSSVSFFPSARDRAVPSDKGAEWTPERRSVDGMYHGSPPPYRYGFTPGDQYIDLFNMPTLCTTAMTKFQRQKTDVSLTIQTDEAASQATTQAEAALRRGDKDEAQRILRDALGEGE